MVGLDVVPRAVAKLSNLMQNDVAHASGGIGRRRASGSMSGEVETAGMIQGVDRKYSAVLEEAAKQYDRTVGRGCCWGGGSRRPLGDAPLAGRLTVTMLLTGQRGGPALH